MGKEAEHQVPSLGLEIIVDSAGTIAAILCKNYAEKLGKFECCMTEVAYLHDNVQYLHYKSQLTLVLCFYAFLKHQNTV